MYARRTKSLICFSLGCSSSISLPVELRRADKNYFCERRAYQASATEIIPFSAAARSINRCSNIL